jgi:hypothetical protein
VRTRRLVAASLVLAALSACSPPPTGVDVPILTKPASSVGRPCLGVSLGRVRLGMDQAAETGEQVFIESGLMGRLTPIWPNGWTARLDPDLRIYDRSGRVIVSVREPFEAGGQHQDDGTVWMCEINRQEI